MHTMDMRSDTQRQDHEQHIRGTTIVAHASKKITDIRLNWYGHDMMRRDEEHILRKLLRTDIGPTSKKKIR